MGRREYHPDRGAVYRVLTDTLVIGGTAAIGALEYAAHHPEMTTRAAIAELIIITFDSTVTAINNFRDNDSAGFARRFGSSAGAFFGRVVSDAAITLGTGLGSSALFTYDPVGWVFLGAAGAGTAFDARKRYNYINSFQNGRRGRI